MDHFPETCGTTARCTPKFAPKLNVNVDFNADTNVNTALRHPASNRAHTTPSRHKDGCTPSSLPSGSTPSPQNNTTPLSISSRYSVLQLSDTYSQTQTYASTTISNGSPSYITSKQTLSRFGNNLLCACPYQSHRAQLTDTPSWSASAARKGSGRLDPGLSDCYAGQ